jgi:hypothetical protein
VWRWDIEVNFRDEKSVLGVGQAMVRHPASVETVPATAVAAYSLLLVAAAEVYGKGGSPRLPAPKWRPKNPPRISTQALVNELRRELWRDSLNKHHFTSPQPPGTKPQKINPPLKSALLYAIKA